MLGHKMKRQLRRCAGAIAACALLATCGKVAQSPYVESVEELPSGFFRVFADIKVKETGEIVKLDYVVACGGTVTNWTYTTPSASFGMSPHIMIVPTASGELIGARTPEVCDASDWEPERHRPRGKPEYVIERVPDDFLPLLMWYPNADDIGFAFGYLSDKAYESPYAKIEVLRSGIAKSSLEEWLIWREEAASDYKQVGALPGPWGHQLPGRIGSSQESQAELQKLNGGRDADVSMCHQAGKMDLPDTIRSHVLALFPETDRKWIAASELNDEDSKKLLKLLRSAEFNGGSYYSHTRLYAEDGVRRSTGGGAFSRIMDAGSSLDKNDFYHDKYPVAIFQKVSETGVEGNAWEHRILFDAEWNGFSLCGIASPSVEDLVAYGRGEIDEIRPAYEQHSDQEPQWLMAGEEVVATNTGDDVVTNLIEGSLAPVISRDGKIISDCCIR